ncbi:MAG TPA: aldehyde dehydrogenase family protein [Woeseiaceae bacterium]|nr:aldehyde dehydrogenase family protein [Woeseiaceae bacterium]
MSIETVSEHVHETWRDIAARELARAESRFFIDGRFVDAVDGGRFESVNPATSEVIAAVAAANEKDVDAAVAAARRTFRSGVWSRLAPRERMEVLYRFTELIDEDAERLAVLDTLNAGKPIADVLDIDLPSVIETFRFMAECIDKIEGTVTNTEADVMHFVLREPLGVVGAISPWNYPLLMATWKVAPALAAGNCVVLKPAEQAPLSCLRLAELFVEAGGPPGVFNVINGIGEIAGKALALHADVDKITFTGSTEVGKLMLQYAGQSNMKRVALECGGKTPQIFMSDLDDMDRAVTAAYNGVFANMGEVCNAGSRLLVDRAIYGEFIERFVASGRDAYTPGDPLDPSTNLGPLVTREAQQRVLSLIDAGRKQGATLRFGGEVPEHLRQGAYVTPALFTEVDNSMRIAQEEIFGPVAAIIPFEDIADAVRIANDTIYGLAAGIWTRDLNRAHRLVREIEAGVVWVNCFDEGDMTQPFGGYKQSGNARDKCMESLLSYTQTKSAWIRLS